MHALQANSTTIRKLFTNRLLIENDHHVFSGAMVNDTAPSASADNSAAALRAAENVLTQPQPISPPTNSRLHGSVRPGK